MVEIQGHADLRGSDAHNLALTANRAAAVRQALVERGVEDARLRSVGYGSRCPIDPRDDARASERNRRVEFKILETIHGPTGTPLICPAGRNLAPK